VSLPPQIVHDTFTVVIPTGARAPATAERRNLLFACGGSSPGQVPGRHYHCNGCPTLRGFRSVGTTDHSPCSFVTAKPSDSCYIFPMPNRLHTVLRRRTSALHHHQLLSAPAAARRCAKSRSLSSGLGARPEALSSRGGRLGSHARACSLAKSVS